MEICPACGRPLVPFRAKLVCQTPGCGFMENCCDGGRMARCSRPAEPKPQVSGPPGLPGVPERE